MINEPITIMCVISKPPNNHIKNNPNTFSPIRGLLDWYNAKSTSLGEERLFNERKGEKRGGESRTHSAPQGVLR